MAQLAVLSSSAAIDPSALLQTEPVAKGGRVAEEAPARNAVETPEQKLTAAERDGMLKQLNKTLEAFDTHVALSRDEKSRQTVIRVIDNESGKVIRQIPNEQLLKISQSITELLGVIYDEKM